MVSRKVEAGGPGPQHVEIVLQDPVEIRGEVPAYHPIRSIVGIFGLRVVSPGRVFNPRVAFLVVYTAVPHNGGVHIQRVYGPILQSPISTALNPSCINLPISSIPPFPPPQYPPANLLHHATD